MGCTGREWTSQEISTTSTDSVLFFLAQQWISQSFDTLIILPPGEECQTDGARNGDHNDEDLQATEKFPDEIGLSLPKVIHSCRCFGSKIHEDTERGSRTWRLPLIRLLKLVAALALTLLPHACSR